MKVVCDNCRAVYKVPDDRLTKAVNKATCRNCGHRMLIPRPKPNADPEERTLVTAVPPTPAGAPPRRDGPGQDEGESTLPGRAPLGPLADDLHMATPMMAARIGDTLQAPEAYEPDPVTHIRTGYEPDPATHMRTGPSPSEQSTAKPSRQPPSRPPAPPPPARRSQTPAPPPSSWESSPQQTTALLQQPRHPTPPPPDRRDAGVLARRTPPMAPQRQTPAPAAPRGAPQASYPGPGSLPPISRAPTPMPAPVNLGPQVPGHDPAHDLNWALLGTCLALLGSVLLSVLSIWNHALLLWFGLAMTFGGGVLSFMVLLTGGRGRRPAQTLLSVVLGFLVAILMSSLLVGTKWGVEWGVENIRFAENGAAGVATPTASGTPNLSSVAPAPMPVPVAETVAPPAPEPVEEPAPPTPGARPRPQPAPRPQPRPVAPQPMPAMPAPAPAPAAPVQPGAPAQMVTVPIEAVDVMVKNNIEVKKCFVPLFKAGSLPPRVDAKFSITPPGQATGVTILQQQYRGTELEACLARAIGTIRFPATSGQGTSITYPFILQ